MSVTRESINSCPALVSLGIPQKQRQLLVPVGHKAPSGREESILIFLLSPHFPDRWKVFQPGSKQEFYLMPNRLQSMSAQLQVSNFGNLAAVCGGQRRKEGNKEMRSAGVV